MLSIDLKITSNKATFYNHVFLSVIIDVKLEILKQFIKDYYYFYRPRTVIVLKNKTNNNSF